MWPLHVILVATLWGVVGSQSITPTPCCTDHQFELFLGEVAGAFYTHHGVPSSKILTGGNTLHFDEYQKKAVIESRLHDQHGNRVESNVFMDFNINKQFVMFPNGTCHEMPAFQAIRHPCIPANATFTGSSDFGFGPSLIPVNNFMVRFAHRDTVLRVSVTKLGCIPMVETINGHHIPQPNGHFVTQDLVFLMTNFKPGLSKPELFKNFPTNCHQSSDEAIPAHTRRAVDAFKLLYTENL